MKAFKALVLGDGLKVNYRNFTGTPHPVLGRKGSMWWSLKLTNKMESSNFASMITVM